MRAIIAVIAALFAASPSPAEADAPPDDGGPRVNRPAYRHYLGPIRPRPHRPRSYGGHRRSFVEHAPAYGPHPPFYPGAGGAAPHGPAVLAEYSEPYIGRGLIYNVPPNPFLVSETVVRALN